MIEGQPKQPAAGWTPLGYKQDSRPQRGWWAPGSYLNKCLSCGEKFIGDKRAGSCADCAYREAAAESAQPPVEGETRVRLQRAGSPAWSPMLRTSDLQFSLYADGTFEIRDGGAVYVHLTPEETSAMLTWLDARERENQ